MPDPFVIHRTGRVSDRETGEVIGEVSLNPSYPEERLWNAVVGGRILTVLEHRTDAARLLWERWQEQKGGRDG